MATNFNKSKNTHLGRGSSSEAKAQKKSRNWLVIILIVVFILLFLGLIISTYQYSFAPKTQPVQTDYVGGTESTISSNITPDRSPTGIFIYLLGMIFTGGSFWLLLFVLPKFDKQYYYNTSNSFTLISNSLFFYISLIMGIIYAFYIGGWSLVHNVNNIDINILIEKSTLIQMIYVVLSFVLLIENYIKTGFSIPITLARTGIFVTIGLTFIVVGYILGMILFYIFVVWLVFKVIFGMMDAERKRREEQDRMDRWANSFVDALKRELSW